MQTARLVRTLGAEAARLANIAALNQPDARQHEIGALGDPADDRAQEIGQGSILGHGNHDIGQVRAVHLKKLRNFAMTGNECS